MRTLGSVIPFASAAAIAMAMLSATSVAAPTYRIVVPDWGIAAIGNGHEGAGADANFYYSWNGHDLRRSAGDHSNSDSFDWGWQINAVNASGTAVGYESVTYPASTSGIPSSTQYRALVLGGAPDAEGFSENEDLGQERAIAIADDGTIAALAAVIDPKGAVHWVSGFVAPGSFRAKLAVGAMNAEHEVAGTSSVTRSFGMPITDVPPPVHVFTASPRDGYASMTDLGAVPACPNVTVNGMDAAGDIVGNCGDGTLTVRSWRWDHHGFVTLPPLPGDRSTAVDGVESGGVAFGSSASKTGQRAVLWDPSGVHLLASLAEPVPGLTLELVLASNDNGTLLVLAKQGAGERNVVLTTDAGSADAIALAHGPKLPTPSPTPTDAPAPDPSASATTPAPQPTDRPTPNSIYTDTPPQSTSAQTSTVSAIRPNWSRRGGTLVTDATHAYEVVPGAIRGLGALGKPLWSHPILAGATVVPVGETVVVGTAAAITALDASTGAVRWSHLGAQRWQADASEVDVATSAAVRRYALESGALLGSMTTPDTCTIPDFLTPSALGCSTIESTETEVLTGYDFATGKHAWSIDGIPASTDSLIFAHTADTAYINDGGVIVALHPAARTYDTLALAAEGSLTLSLDGRFMYGVDDRHALRFRPDVDLAKQQIARISFFGGYAESAGTVVAFAPDGSLFSAVFDASGRPIETTYPTVRRDGYSDTVTASGSHAFVTTTDGWYVLDLHAKRVVGKLPKACAPLNGGAILGNTAIVSCGDPSYPAGSTLAGIRLP